MLLCWKLHSGFFIFWNVSVYGEQRCMVDTLLQNFKLMHSLSPVLRSSCRRHQHVENVPSEPTNWKYTLFFPFYFRTWQCKPHADIAKCAFKNMSGTYGSTVVRPTSHATHMQHSYYTIYIELAWLQWMHMPVTDLRQWLPCTSIMCESRSTGPHRLSAARQPYAGEEGGNVISPAQMGVVRLGI